MAPKTGKTNLNTNQTPINELDQLPIDESFQNHLLTNSDEELNSTTDQEKKSQIKAFMDFVTSNYNNKRMISNSNYKRSRVLIENSDQTNTVDKLKFKLNLKLRNELNVLLNDFTSLLYENKNLNNENEINRINDLIYRFADLPLKLDNFYEDEIDSIERSLIKPTLILDSKLRTEILDLLIKNKNYSILTKQYSIDKNVAKSNLINENNQMISKLLNQPVQMLKVDTSTNGYLTTPKEFNNLFDLKDFNDAQYIESNDRIIKFEKTIDKLEKEISRLKISSNSIGKETNILYELDTRNFDKNPNYVHRTPKFDCLGLDWYIKIEHEEGIFKFCLVLMNELVLNRSVSVECILEILNQNCQKDNEEMYLYYHFVPDKVAAFDRSFSDIYLKNNELNKNDRLILKLNINAEWI